jgi:hypothetical protein
MQDIITILSSAAISALLSAALIFLSKTWISERLKGAIKNEYDQKLETHKAQLKAQSDVSLEEFKAKLQLAASERNIRLTRVFEDTVDAISGTYSRLLAFKDAVAHYTSIVELAGTPPKEVRRKIAGEAYQDLHSFYRPRRPFLPKQVVKKIDDLKTRLDDAAIDFRFGVEQGGDDRAIEKGEEIDSWMKAHKVMTKEVPQLLELLEEDLRKALGTHND